MQFDGAPEAKHRGRSHLPWQNTITEQNIHIIGDSETGGKIKAGSKWELMSSLHAILCARENLEQPLCAEIEKELMEREKLMSTGIGEQMAIPHAVVAGVDRFMTECAIIRNGIDFESIDGTPAFIVVLLVAPKSALQEHLKVMASIAQVFYKAELRQRVIAATTAAEALRIIKEVPA